eukprot:4756868-Pleurochrysis_carterae.AAC.1
MVHHASKGGSLMRWRFLLQSGCCFGSWARFLPCCGFAEARRAAAAFAATISALASRQRR